MKGLTEALEKAFKSSGEIPVIIEGVPLSQKTPEERRVYAENIRSSTLMICKETKDTDSHYTTLAYQVMTPEQIISCEEHYDQYLSIQRERSLEADRAARIPKSNPQVMRAKQQDSDFLTTQERMHIENLFLWTRHSRETVDTTIYRSSCA
jgi:beta-N-acetylglucosaminidase